MFVTKPIFITVSDVTFTAFEPAVKETLSAGLNEVPLPIVRSPGLSEASATTKSVPAGTTTTGGVPPGGVTTDPTDDRVNGPNYPTAGEIPFAA